MVTDDQRYAAIKKLIKEYTVETTATPEKSREALIKEGIYTTTGELAPQYGGKPKMTSTQYTMSVPVKKVKPERF